MIKRKIPGIFPLLIFTGQSLFAEENDVSGTLFHHVSNGTELDLFPYLPPITLPFGMTVHQFMLVLSVLLILVLYGFFSKKEKMKPKKLQLALESVILFVRDDIVYSVMGKEKGRPWVPFYSAMFLFLITVNFLGLIPAFKTATGNINVTMSLAILILILTFVVGFREIGAKAFFKNLYPSDTPFGIGIFVALLEFLSVFTKSLILGLRLFANMFAGHMAILSFLVLIFIISPFFGFVAVPFAAFTYLLEVLIAFLQAFVFTLLSCIFISMASSH